MTRSGGICISVTHSKFWGVVPRLPLIYAHVFFLSVCMYDGVVADENITE